MNSPTPAMSLVSALSSTQVVPLDQGGRTEQWWEDPVVRRAAFLGAVVVIALLTAVARKYHQTTSYELFVDEIQYADVANSFAAGHDPQLFGQPFYLHPSLFFAFVGALMGSPVPHLTAGVVLGLRYVEVFFAALNAMLVIAIARQLTGRRIALLAGVLYALDPFIGKFDSRLMLEAPTLTATLAGLAAGLVGVRSEGRVRTAWLVAAGVAFGIAVTTKSTSALVTTLPLILMALTSAGPRRRESIGMIVVQCAVYACYVAWTWSTGHFGDWFTQTLHGVVRATAKPQTGFNTTIAPTFDERIVALIAQFGPSYLLILVAAVAILTLLFVDLRSRGPQGRHGLGEIDATVRMLTCWLAGLLLSVCYTAAFGELEEQTFYLMAVPSTVVIAILIARTNSRRGQALLWAGTAAVLCWSATVWVNVHTVPDDAYARMSDHLAAERSTGTVIALGELTGQFVLPGYGLVPLHGSTPPPEARYALVSTALAGLHLAPITSDDVAELDRKYPVAFVATGRTVGELRLYDLRSPLNGGQG